ncbi:isocitrate lyase/phosphoenolpyruvate mutase family protein [Sulfitobacter pseudonitzschiae]|uniref:Isocitrate lyase/phosphoenolpyruvate mutase family protein n=1 Tax=Pseudosulfitobacter pseudonitzschiae TaxID=1402135 RepID=A0A9Q2NPS4_9RHOB|nr:isocitrate lyase/phosphoenolpyruvate mutase family protein [Pseudosulfitobacter pseudonitzschiae]MBM2293092.1 isocitrate lyase/phosphoenolpyruvate mutase family protein [Pseudosulfitobacter pseudonitzschiae]MBM2297620.1 isocitrate lyase/phosphoenolpyruvate mutase family protein [Pseudosulfitobacter pseudonitzschiae]MBM2302534.1 isocitrate lyase/phosphoenolpyruvate mutase family protein [Pseudosulfitobacter pseudonitzschiae]MBM2312476.1 isocitrate lyase/phosphoenolpyruvate mutase family prote
MRKTSKSLREIISSGGMARVMAAHDPLSARLVEEAGFDAIWASGFEISAAMGLADVSLVSMTQHLDNMRRMADRSSLPIVADVDTGYGNAVNVIFTVKQFEAAGASAVVIEDKAFPKVTSLIAGGRQDLLPISENQGKIEAAVSARQDPDFLVIARVEALIAGRGEAEALERAHAYEAAGADMILIHSKEKTPDEIESFIHGWTGSVPIVIVPTAYPQMTEARAKSLKKVRMLIYGNHAIRAAVTGMQKVFAQIIADGGIETVNDEIVPVSEIFRLQDMDMVKQIETQFLR